MNFENIFFKRIENIRQLQFNPKKEKNLKAISHSKNICLIGSQNIGKSYLIRKVYTENGVLPKRYQNMLMKDKYYTFYRRNNFFEINCSHLGYKDKHILYHFLNDVSTSHKQKKENIVYLRNIHDLTLDALYTLRGLIDNYENFIHFIFSSKSDR